MRKLLFIIIKVSKHFYCAKSIITIIVINMQNNYYYINDYEYHPRVAHI